MDYPSGLLFDPTLEPYREPARLVPPPPLSGSRFWVPGPIIDQSKLTCTAGHTFCTREHPFCAAATAAQMLSSMPIPYVQPIDVVDLYHAAQRRDPFPGEDYAGTTLSATFGELQARGLIASFRQLGSVDDIARAVLRDGPVAIGVRWLDGMRHPDVRSGYLSLSGPDTGPHACVVYGVEIARDAAHLVLSWGKQWGMSGTAVIRISDLAQVFSMAGEAWSIRKAFVS